MSCQPRAGRLVGLDEQPAMLAAYAEGADRLGIDHDEIPGRWPAAATDTQIADVVVCHHVLYNVADLAPFIAALHAHARRRVVIEITDRHPQASLNTLWAHFHDIERPDGPRAEDAIAVLDELGLPVQIERFTRTDRLAGNRATHIRFARRRLCLPPDRIPEIARLLAEQTIAPTEFVTLWWDQA